MSSKKQSLEHLRSVPLFSGCTAKDLEKVLKAGDEVAAKAGQVIIDQGQTGREAFVLLNGSKVATLSAGAIVGELALFDHGPRTATVVCDSDSELLVIGQREFLGVLAEVPSLNRKMLEYLAGKIREFDRQSFG